MMLLEFQQTQIAQIENIYNVDGYANIFLPKGNVPFEFFSLKEDIVVCTAISGNNKMDKFNIV